MMKKLLFLFSMLMAAGITDGQIRLPAIIRDSMILQRDAKVNVWGWAAPNEKVNVRFNNKTYHTKGDVNGKWLVQLPPTKSGGPYTIQLRASNTITLKEILFGDVWLFSGQSNMVHQLNIHDVTYAQDIAAANDPDIRQFWVPTITDLRGPQGDLPVGYWKPAVGADVRPFSAVAYFFAKKIHARYHIPIGIINSSVGGPPIEAWTSEEGLASSPAITSTIVKNKDTVYLNSLTRRPLQSSAQPARVVSDAGLTANVKWYDPSYIPKAWRPISVPGFWEDQGLKDLNGTVWYRREIDVPASMVGKPGRVFLGRIVDMDELYINGKRIGNTTYQYPQRRYALPADVLKAGKNIIVVRVTNTNGKGGFVPDKPYCLFTGTDTIDLTGYWQYKVGDVFTPAPSRGFGGFSAQDQPTSLYNAMIAPVTNYNIKGICWYQGEGNTGRPEEYAKLLPAVIADWRHQWKQPALPFLFVQLPNFGDYNYLPSGGNWALLRESQLKSLTVPNTAMAVTIDLGEWNELHPDNKKGVGERLALGALKLAYQQDIVYSGPVYQSATIEGNKIVISFTQTGSGLTTTDNEPPGEFAIAGADKKFIWAKAKIEGNKIIVWSEEVPVPLYVRYAWADNPVNPNLANKEGLPASPFRTDQ